MHPSARWHAAYDATAVVKEDWDVVRAFINKDADALRAALLKSPESRSVMMWDVSRKRTKTHLCTLDEAALAMRWVAAIEPLWEAGMRFEATATHRSLLDRATLAGCADIVKIMFAKGFDPNGTREDRPLLQLGFDDGGNRSRAAHFRATCKAYAKAGVDPWALTPATPVRPQGPDITLIEALLAAGKAQACAFFLDYAQKTGRQVPPCVRDNPDRFDAALHDGLSFHSGRGWPRRRRGIGTLATWQQHREAFAGVAKLAATSGIPMPGRLVDDLAQYLASADGDDTLIDRASVATALDTAQFLSEAWPEAGLKLSGAVWGCKRFLTDEEASLWQRRHLAQASEASSPVLGGARGRPRI